MPYLRRSRTPGRRRCAGVGRLPAMQNSLPSGSVRVTQEKSPAFRLPRLVAPVSVQQATSASTAVSVALNGSAHQRLGVGAVERDGGDADAHGRGMPPASTFASEQFGLPRGMHQDPAVSAVRRVPVERIIRIPAGVCTTSRRRTQHPRARTRDPRGTHARQGHVRRHRRSPRAHPPRPGNRRR
jgi:hypothetical protein